MKMDLNNLPELASLLEVERKRQKLSRAQAAAVCNVSTSFIRDAETQPERCTLGKLVQLVSGLGLTITVTSPRGDAPTGGMAGMLQDAKVKRATDALKPGFVDERATDALARSSASARRAKE
jgi:HTH-type transcriptional regulator/antitoxin HipB